MRWLLALTLVACSSSDKGTGDGGSPDAGGGTVTALEITPSSTTVTLTSSGAMTWSGSASFTARATYADGKNGDVTQQATWSGDSGVSVTAGTASVSAPGRHQISASYGGASGSATLDAQLTTSADAPGFDAANHAKLDGAATGAAPSIAYPLAGALFPANLAPVEIHLQKSDPSQTLARVRFAATPLLQLDYYATCQGSPNAAQFPNACIITLSGAYVPNLVGASATTDITMTARLAAPDGSHLGESAPISLGWADMELSGGLYYWTTAGKGDSAFNTAVARYDFAGDTSTPSIYLSSDQAPAVPQGQTQCIGCHAVSPDGEKLAFSLGGSLPGYFSLFDVGTKAPIATRMTDKFVNMTTFSPDGKQMVNMAYGQLTLRTADANLTTIADNLFASTVNEKISHPFWSPDGRWLAFVSWVPGQFGAVNDEHVTGDMVQGAQIWIAPSDPNTHFGTPQKLVPRSVSADGKSGYSYYYPAVSDDGEWVVFNRSSCSGPADANTTNWGAGACDGYNDFSAQLMLVSTGGAAPIALDAANGAQTWTNSWPRWSPGHGQYRGRKLYFVAFSSRRDFGLSLKGSTDGTSKPQLWFAAVAPSGENMTDPSFAPVWLPGQDPDLTGPRGNHTPVWTSVAVPIK